MKKDLKYFMALPYKIEITPLPEGEGGGYMASIPQLGSYAFVGDGDTIQEAIDSLHDIKEIYFKKYLDKGIAIPEPEPRKAQYSGKFVLRIPKVLHRQLAIEASENEISLNQYVMYLLTANHQHSSMKALLSDLTVKMSELREEFGKVSYFFSGQGRKSDAYKYEDMKAA